MEREKNAGNKGVRFNLRISQKVADELLQGKSRFSQVVLRKSTKKQKANAPFFAYVVETSSDIRYVAAESRSGGYVVNVDKGNVASVSDGIKKAIKMNLRS